MARDDVPESNFPPGQSGVPAPTAEYPAVTATVGPAGPPPVEPPQPLVGARPAMAGGFPRSLFWLAATAALVLAMVLGVRSAGLWPSLTNPFGTERTDRSQPVLLKSIQDMSRFVAAEGNLEVIVDLQNNRKHIPDFLVSERTLFVAAGTVEAYVDFADIGEGAITESADGTRVDIKLPAPALGKPNIDNERSYVFASEKGLLNHIGDMFKDDPNRMQEIYRLAEEKIAASAKVSGLPEQAEKNTRKMLEGMLRSLGYTTVTVTFAAP